MIPLKHRRSIEDILETYGNGIRMVSDDRMPLDSFMLIGEVGAAVYVKGHTRFINYARDIRDNAYVPECFSDEASTWS